MKNLKFGLTTLMLLIAALVSGCAFHHDEVLGSGQRQRQKREVPAFTSISTAGAYDVEVTVQKETSLEIEADDNILPLITTDVSSGVLRIRSKKGYSTDEPIKLKITTPTLEGLSTSGVGKIEISGLQNDKFEIESSGAPTIKASGESKTLRIKANGAGKIDAHKIRAASAFVESNGVAKVEVFASEELNANVSGPSQVVYSGDPKVTKSVHGPGSVEKKASEGS